MTVNASDSDGSIANVVLSLDGNVVRQENASPYEWDDAELQSLSVGAHELTAVATDNDGATTSTSISVEVIAAVVPEPVEPEPVEPEPIDEEPVRPEPVEPDPVEPEPIDEEPVRPEPVEPDPVEPEPIDEDPVRPEPVEPDPVIAGLSLSFDTPANGATIPVGSDVPVLVTATQSNGDIAEVSLSLNGDLVRIERFEPFSWADGDRNMDPALQDMPAGSYVLIAVATNDAGGSITESVSFEVTDTGDSDRPPVEPPVEPVEPPIANTGPAVSFATPADGATFEQGDTVTVIANATDPDDGIDNVRLSVDGSFVRQENRAPYRWGNRDSVMQNLSVGTHELTLVATDHSGRPASDTISITVVANEEPVPPPPVEPPPVDEPSDGRDLVSLHYDNAPDQDDGHALVAGRVLADTFDVRAMAVNGTYGEGRRNDFNTGSERVFDRAWPNGLDAFNDRDGSVEAAAEAWSETISDGGTVYVADGGPSDFTAAVLREMPAGQRSSVTVVQHSDWNENNTDDDELDFVRDVTNYIRIDDGNHPDNDTADLETRSGEGDFVDAALDSEWSDEWEAAFDYLNPGSKLDFSDTVEFLFILDVPLSRVRDWNDFADEFFR